MLKYLDCGHHFIILCISNHHVVHLEYIQFFFTTQYSWGRKQKNLKISTHKEYNISHFKFFEELEGMNKLFNFLKSNFNVKIRRGEKRAPLNHFNYLVSSAHASKVKVRI